MMSPKLNPFSKILILISVIAVGLALLCIGGTMAGWDIVGALTSSTAVLIYSILLLVTLLAVSYLCLKKFK